MLEGLVEPRLDELLAWVWCRLDELPGWMEGCVLELEVDMVCISYRCLEDDPWET